MERESSEFNRSQIIKALNLLILMIATVWMTQGFAGPREQAYRLHNRLTGVPPEPAVLTQMESLITAGQAESAAYVAMNNPYFYNLVLKKWFKKFSNVDDSERVALNDYVATAIGLVRDDVRFDQVMYGDILYTSNAPGLTAYANDSNAHYEEAEAARVDLAGTLVQRTQSTVTGISDTAGVLTTRASGVAFMTAGTNRRVNRFAFMNFLCKDYEALSDITRPDIYVRRDVDRAPGGDSRTFRNKCVGCHAGQDAIAGAWAYFDFIEGNNGVEDGQVVYSPGTVVEKVNRNNLFNDGHVVTSDYFTNIWATGQNASLGWRGAQDGYGAKAVGRLLASTRAFSDCMALRVFKLVCLKEPQQQVHLDAIQANADAFEANNSYNMKSLIAKTSVLCLGE